jgi:hypothetical protein
MAQRTILNIGMRDAKTVGDIHPNAFGILAARLEEMYATASKVELTEAERELRDFFMEMLRSVPPEVASAIAKGDNPELEAAYRLGQLSFAQSQLAQVAERRADDDFVDIMLGECRPIVEVLIDGDLSTDEVVIATGLDEAVVKVGLKVMREKGISDFRMEGVAVNVLTPAALAVAEAKGLTVPNTFKR